MNILLIDNTTLHINELKNELSKYATTLTTQNFENVDYTKAKNFDLVILSGNSKSSYTKHKEAFDRETNFIKNGQVPIIGICFGLMEIVYAFGGKAHKMIEKTKGKLSLKIISEDPIFENLKQIDVFEAHRAAIAPKDLGNTLIPLATSKFGVEIVKHPTKPIYGFQFHPEIHVDKNVGYKLLKNTIGELIK